MNTPVNDQYCLRVTRYGAAGIEEDEGRLNMHMLPGENAKGLLDLVFRSLCPGDRAEITLTRGVPAPFEMRHE